MRDHRVTEAKISDREDGLRYTDDSSRVWKDSRRQPLKQRRYFGVRASLYSIIKVSGLLGETVETVWGNCVLYKSKIVFDHLVCLIAGWCFFCIDSGFVFQDICIFAKIFNNMRFTAK